eukprot:Em0005g1411a
MLLPAATLPVNAELFQGLLGAMEANSGETKGPPSEQQEQFTAPDAAVHSQRHLVHTSVPHCSSSGCERMLELTAHFSSFSINWLFMLSKGGLGSSPDGFDAVSVQNVGSTYIIVSWDLPTHSLPVTPTGTALQLECGVGRHQCCSQPAQHEDSPPGGPPDPESDTNDIVISLFINKIINPDKSFGSSSDPMCILLPQLSSLLVEHTAPNIHDSKCLGA